MSNTKQFPVYSVESPLIKLGAFTDSKGEMLNVTPEVIEDIFNSINQEAPLLDVHDNEQVGQIKKVIKKSDGLYQKSIITDNPRFSNRYNNGHSFISPEIVVETSNGKVINAALKGAALTSNPGMVHDAITVTQHNFEAPIQDNDNNTLSQSQFTTPTWTEPLGELKTVVNNLNATINTFGEQVKNMTTQNNPTEPQDAPTKDGGAISMSADDLAKLINDAVEKRLKESSAQPSVPEASEVAAPVVNNEPDEMAKQYANIVNKLQEMEKLQEKAYQKQFKGIVSELKSLGIEHPEKMVPEGIGTEQKITILETFKENFAKNSPMSSPLQEPIAGAPGGNAKKNEITVDDILTGYFDTVYGPADGTTSMANDPALRHSLSKLSDPDLMRRYNMNVLFDSNGKYIGPL